MKENNEPSIQDVGGEEEVEPVSKKTILVVDDEPNMCRMIKACFESEVDYHVEAANSGNGAKDKIDKDGYNPHAILSDLQMPDGNGADLLNWLMIKRPDLAKRTIFGRPYETVNKRSTYWKWKR